MSSGRRRIQVHPTEQSARHGQPGVPFPFLRRRRPSLGVWLAGIAGGCPRSTPTRSVGSWTPSRRCRRRRAAGATCGEYSTQASASRRPRGRHLRAACRHCGSSCPEVWYQPSEPLARGSRPCAVLSRSCRAHGSCRLAQCRIPDAPAVPIRPRTGPAAHGGLRLGRVASIACDDHETEEPARRLSTLPRSQQGISIVQEISPK